SVASAVRSAWVTKSAGPFLETCRCSTSLKSRSILRAALRAASSIALISADFLAIDLALFCSRRREYAARSVGALHILVSFGVDHDLLADAAERRHHDANSVFHDRRLVGGGGCLPLHGRLGLGNFQDHLLGQDHVEGAVLMELDLHIHAVFQEGGALADHILGDIDLLIACGIHEGQHLAIFKKELVRLLFEADALHGFGGAEALVEFRAIAQVLEFDLQIGAALAGLGVLNFYGHPQTALMFNHIAGADRISVNFHGCLALSKNLAATYQLAITLSITSFMALTAWAGPFSSVHTPPPTARKSAPARSSGSQFAAVIPPMATEGTVAVSLHHVRISRSAGVVSA